MLKTSVFYNPSYWNQLQRFLHRHTILIKRNYSKHNKIFYPKTIFSAIQPTGLVHIGNYFGAIQNWIKLQNNGENVIWSIADMHAITLPQDPTSLVQNILNLTATLLACGIDPNKSILFQQSMVPMHAELSWVFACLLTMPRLARQPQFTEKSKQMKDVPLGLYIYPVLQTADILLYKATHVPVGRDQAQHVQLAEHLAQKFNVVYGETFPMPITLLDENLDKIKSLRFPEQKMSKSGVDIGCLNLTDDPSVIRKKIVKAVTDFTSAVTYDPQTRPGVSNLLNIHSTITGESPAEICEKVKHLNTGEYKLVLADIVIEKFTPIRQRMNEYINDPDYLQTVLLEGASKAEAIANENWLEVRKKVGFGNGRCRSTRSVAANS